jgi:hypothetical protein
VLAGHAAVAECAVGVKDALKVWIGDGVRRRSAPYPIEFHAFRGVPRARLFTPERRQLDRLLDKLGAHVPNWAKASEL